MGDLTDESFHGALADEAGTPFAQSDAPALRFAALDAAAMKSELPAVLTGDTVLFPTLSVPVVLSPGREARAVEAAARAPARLLAFLARRPRDDTFDLAEGVVASNVGVVGRVVRLSHSDGTIHALIQGITRARIALLAEDDPYPRARVTPLLEPPTGPEAEQLRLDVLEAFRVLVSAMPALERQLADAEQHAQRPGDLADFITANAPFKPAERQHLLETLEVGPRLREVLSLLRREQERLRVQAAIEESVQRQTDRQQREFILREQLEAIRRELGESTADELADLRQRLEAANPPEEARRSAERELARLEMISPLSPEHGLVRTYLEWIADLPWGRSTPDHLDLVRAAAVLDEDHFGLQPVKERILQYLAVRKLRNDARGPILCFVGPPGVGKTSLGQSIARALGREFSRISLGGIRDEAVIRGFRRTYLGALPGRIVLELRRVRTNNPVIMLDELDKLTPDARGDPSAALLEVLDPAQNHAFYDHYLDLPVDLSTVFFICTANQADNIPGPLLDRMEVVEIPSYTDEEKLEIAKRYLVPRRIREAGLTAAVVSIDQGALRAIMRGYTREAGVRSLEREIGAVVRTVAQRVAGGDAGPVTITPRSVEEILGPPRFQDDAAEEEDQIGLAMGLAATSVGGDVLNVEVAVMPGSGKLTLTGQLGEVMRESASAALTYARSRYDALALPPDFFDHRDVHVHVPAGAVPKDGPSAGLPIAIALISAITGRPVRRQVAMTGEITLRGRVLAVGALKEKALAANRIGIRELIAPRANQADWRQIPERVRAEITPHWVERIDDVLPLALHPPPER